MGVTCTRGTANQVAATRPATPPSSPKGSKQLSVVTGPRARPDNGNITFDDSGDLSITSSGYCSQDDLKSLGAMLRTYFPPHGQLAGHTPSSAEFETAMYQWHPSNLRGDDEDDDDGRPNDDDDDGDIDVSDIDPKSPSSRAQVDTAPYAMLLRAVKESSLYHNNQRMQSSAPIVDYAAELKALKTGSGSRRALLDMSPRWFVSNDRRGKMLGMASGHEALGSIGLFSSALSNALYELVETCGRAVSKQLAERRRARRGSRGSSNLVDSVEKACSSWFDAHAAAQSRAGAGRPVNLEKGVAPLTAVAGVAFKLLFVMSGGVASFLADDRRLASTADGQFACSDDDGALQLALVVDAVNHVVSLSKLAGFDGYSGMHTVEAAEEWLCALRQIFVACGALPPQLSTKLRPQHTYLEWIQLLPMFALTESSKQGLMYLYAIVAGQQRVVLQPIMRGNVLASLALALQKDPVSRELFRYTINAETTRFTPPSSHKAFPIFATEGIGLESGEGHGPRKELFDSVSIDYTATRSPPVDLTSAVSVTVLSSMKELNSTRIAKGQAVSGIGAVCLLAWRQSKLVRRFYPGDSLTVSMVLRPNASFVANHSRGDQPQQHNITECWTVEKEIDAVSPNETILLLASTTRLPQGYRLESLHVSQKREPLFIHENGEESAWINPSLDCDAVAMSQSWAAGWALANAIPNGLMLSAPLPPLLFHFIRLFDTATMRFPPEVREGLTDHLDLLTLSLVKPSLVANAKQVVELTSREFEDMATAEGMDPKRTTRGQYIRESIVNGTVFCCGASADTTMSLLESFCRGFYSSSASSCAALLFSGSAKHLRRVLCAPVDDGKEDFSFQAYFRLVEDAEFTQFPHSAVFRTLFFRSLEEHEPAMKRQVLKFITGRVLLPHQPKSEHIKVEFPFSPMNAKEFDSALGRLPSSHSCDNVLEMPNYLECLLFGSRSPFYAAAGKPVNSVVLDDAKARAWLLLTDAQRQDVTERTLALMRSKLVAAVEMSGTYELDDGAIRADMREAFDRQFASAAAASSSAPAEESSLRTVNGSLPRLASNIERSVSPPTSTSPVRDRSPSFFRRKLSIAASPPLMTHHRSSVSPSRENAHRQPLSAALKRSAQDSDDDDDDNQQPLNNIHSFTSPNQASHRQQQGGVVLGQHRSGGGGGPREQLPETITPSRASRPTGSVSVQRLSVFSKQNDALCDVDDDVLHETLSASKDQSTRPTTNTTSGTQPPMPQPVTPKPRRAADLDDLESELFGK